MFKLFVAPVRSGAGFRTPPSYRLLSGLSLSTVVTIGLLLILLIVQVIEGAVITGRDVNNELISEVACQCKYASLPFASKAKYTPSTAAFNDGTVFCARDVKTGNVGNLLR
jgi:hypothetical protein